MDIRLDTDFFDHKKTVRLRRRLGDAGLVCLQKLWIEAARYEPDGIIDMSEEDIEERMGWKGAPGLFVNALCDEKTQFLDRMPNGDFKLHNWEIRQPLIASQFERSEIYRKNAIKRWSARAGGTQAIAQKQRAKPGVKPIVSEEERTRVAEKLSGLKEILGIKEKT